MASGSAPPASISRSFAAGTPRRWSCSTVKAKSSSSSAAEEGRPEPGFEKAARARLVFTMHKRLGIAFLLVLGLAACSRVTPHVVLPNLRLGEPSFFPTLEAYASAPIVARNSVDLLLNGEEIFPAMIDAIKTARKSITYAQYYYGDGPVAREMAEAFAERCRAGIESNILLDAFGALDMPTEYQEMMKAAGCNVSTFRPLSPVAWDRSNKRLHRRILVVDGQVGFTGGSGVSRKW